MPAALPLVLAGQAGAGIASSAMGASAAGNAADKQAEAAKYATDIQKQMYDQQRSDLQPWRQAGLDSLYGAGGLMTRKDGGTGMAMQDNSAAQQQFIQQQFNQLKAQRDQQLNQVGNTPVVGNDLKNQLMSQMSDDKLMQQAQSAWKSQPGSQGGIDPSAYQVDPNLTRGFTVDDFHKDPGYDFRMQQGQQALERSAAARGGLQSGGTLKAITDYGQNFASNEYQNAYNRFTNDQSNRFNRLSSIAGLGQTSNAQLGAAGQNYANQAGQNMMGAANAQGAAGIAGANAIGQGISTIGNLGGNWMNYTMANQYLKNNGGQGIF